MYEFLYLKIGLLMLVCWIILFFLKPAQRKEMMITSLLGGIAGPIQELWYTKDYWSPSYFGNWPWIEDILFGFSVFGVTAIFYEVFIGSRIKEVADKDQHPLVFLSLTLIGTIGMGLFVPVVNSIYAAIISFIIVWAIIITFRKDLFIPSLASAVLITVFAFLGYKVVLAANPGIIEAWWMLKNISGILISGIPLEEYLWFFTEGLAFGTLYEFWQGIEFKKA
ncbi:MAG: hypothetical protein HYW90_00770 [Candidatus Sungbacteria bacterium]|nr:hypothetical protein [Candidatus Sungbacteria bacterium]